MFPLASTVAVGTGAAVVPVVVESLHAAIANVAASAVKIILFIVHSQK
jgi:hypothetical protein